MIARVPLSFIFFSLIFNSMIQSQTVKVVKVLNSNLFELEDGRKIKLAGIDAPQTDNPIDLLAETAREAVAYYKETLLKRNVTIESASEIDSSDYQLVYLLIKYPLEDSDLNRGFLEKGFGKFFDNAGQAHKNGLLKAEKSAAENRSGIWNYCTPGESDTLDGDLRSGDMTSKLAIDSTKIQKFFIPRPVYYTLPLELFMGSLTTFVGAIGSGLIYAGIVHEHGEMAGLGAVFFGAVIGYLFGFPTGVYIIASHDNPNLSYLTTVGSSVALTLITGGISAAITGENGNHFTRYIAGFSPIIGPLLYVHLFPPAPPNREEFIKKYYENRDAESFRDYYNSTMSFRMELMRIYF